MDWSNEAYVRLYTRDSMSWKRLRWQGQTVLMHLLRKLDRAGIMEGINNLNIDISIMTGLPEEIANEGIEALLREEVLKFDGNILFMPNFLDAQESAKSDRQRQRESREKRRTAAVMSHNVTTVNDNVTTVNDNVTNCHDVTNGVTSCHDVTDGVTDSHDLNFLDAQESAKNDRQQQQESREKTRTAAVMSHNVTLVNDNVTNCHDVTDGVTDSHDVSLFALPCYAMHYKKDMRFDFDIFWKKYPIGKAKKKAMLEWNKLKNKPDIQIILDALENQIKYKNNCDKHNKFCPEFPYAERWIKNKRWEDEIKNDQPHSKIDDYLNQRYEERLKRNKESTE